MPGSPARKFQAHDLLLWEGIERAIERGDSVFDLHGATKGTEGIFKFKEKWADEVVELPYYFYRRDGKDLPYVDPGSARLEMMKKIWRRLAPMTRAALISCGGKAEKPDRKIKNVSDVHCQTSASMIAHCAATGLDSQLSCAGSWSLNAVTAKK